MRNIDVMLSRPGIYLLMTRTVVGLVEVDECGSCFQLELASGRYARDGELRAGRWNTAAITDIHGPFGRTASTVARSEA